MVSAEITTAPFLVEEDGTAALTSGAVGTTLDVVGNATSGAASPFSTVTVYLDALSGTVLGTGSADVNGAYRITVTIPPAVAGVHYIVVNDGETESTGAAFTVTPQLIVNTIPPTPGDPQVLPGDSVTVAGHGFAANDAITLFFNSTTLTTPNSFVITTPAITSNGTGSFSATITIPSTVVLAEFDTYDANATDEATNSAIDQVVIDYYITCTPQSGPTGITTTISGRIAPNTAYTIRFNGAAISTGTTAADGSYSTAYTIPGVLSTGPYTVDIIWATTNDRFTVFTVNPSPTIVLGTSTGIVGDVVTITGSGFSSLAAITLYFDTTMVNDTTMGFGPTTNVGAIPAGSTFVVPTLAPGIYAVSVVDQYGATSATGVFFTIEATPVFMVETRATEYVRMDFISLTSLSTPTATSVVISITDPNGLLWFTEAVPAGEWQQLGAGFQIPYDVLVLTWWPIPSDAPLGAWNFTCWNAAETAILDTNLFTVSAKATQQDVLDAIDGAIDDIADVEDAVNDGVADVLDAIDGVTAIVTASAGDIATIMTDVGQIEVLVSSLDITAITSDLAAIQSDLGTLIIDVADLEAEVTSISGDVATVQTTLGTLQGTITDIDGTTATVETDVGTLQADVSDIKANVDSTPAWIAVVLSLIAAIAAIFAVITIRQKIAG